MTPMNVLDLTLEAEGTSVPLRFPVRRVINAGYVGRDQKAVQAHIEELRREGVPPPAAVPVLLSLTADSVTTAERIEVIGGDTSGEIEYVLLIGPQEEIFVGVGSDHTDRSLERTSLGKSKQICKNVMARSVWRYRDVRDGWDGLLLKSWVRLPPPGEEMVYQQASLNSILHPDDLLRLVRSRTGGVLAEGLTIFSGTIPLATGRFISSDYFRGEMVDPPAPRALRFAYEVLALQDLE